MKLLTDAQAEVAGDIIGRHYDTYSQISADELYPDHDAKSRSKRRTFHNLAARGLLRYVPATGWLYEVTDDLRRAYGQWYEKRGYKISEVNELLP